MAEEPKTSVNSTVGAVPSPAPNSSPLDQLGAAEPIIRIRPFGCQFVEFLGTSAQLKAEDLIPVGVTWPEANTQRTWREGLICYTLSRSRPAGTSARSKEWLTGDWWSLRTDTERPGDWWHNAIIEKRAELEKAIFAASPKGRAEFRKHIEEFYRARADERFQKFKAALIPPRRKKS